MREGNFKKMLMLTDGNIDNASARIRAIQYIPYLEKNNYKVTLIPRIPRKSDNSFYRFIIFPFLKRLFYLKKLQAIRFRKWDCVFIQRTFLSINLLKYLKKYDTYVIYDFDDAIYINRKKPENSLKTAIMVRYSDQVIVSTEYLKEYCILNQKNPAIIPSPVETDRIKPLVKTENHIPVIGWIGSSWTSKFIEIVDKPLHTLNRNNKFIFLTVGARPDYKIEGINHESNPWIFEEENEQINRMDIGIMPLPDTEFAKSKGGYKLLQYMSAGIPCIASPVGINRNIIKSGINGYLASSEEEWFEYLEKLLTNPELRNKLGAEGRKEAVELYSREVCFKSLLNIINRT